MKRNSLLEQSILSYFKKSLVSVATIFLLLLTLTAHSQTPAYYNNNNGASTNVFPLGSTTNRVQWIYGPGVFNSAGATGTPASAGTIIKIYFRLGGTASNTASYSNYTVLLAQNVGTTNAWTSTTWNTGMTTCFYQSTYTMTTAVANGWYGITLSTPFPYDPTKSLVFELTNSAGSGNSVAQNGSTNQRIWGTYGASPGTSYGSGLVDFGVDISTVPNNVGMSAIATPLCAPTLVATFTNYGTNVVDSAKINWSVNGAVQPQNKYNIKTGVGASNKVTLTPDFNFVDASTYSVKVWSSLPNGKKDSMPANDTAKLTFQYLGPSKDPTVTDVIKCGPGKVPLKATPGSAADSIIWYDAAVGGNTIARGKNTLSPALVVGVNTYYVQAFKITNPTSFANAMTPSTGFGSTYSGGFADITPNKGVIIDSFDCQMTSNIQNSTWNVYTKVGTYLGSETTRGAWTQIVFNKAARVRLVGSYYRAYIQIPEQFLLSGKTYGFYIVSTPTTPCSPWCNASVTGGITISNADLTVFQDRVAVGAAEFGSPTLNYPMTWETFYRPANCPSNRVPIKVTVKPSPYGAAFIKGTIFQTTQPNTNGTKGNPDIVANGDKLSYEITPPTGYFNVDYGNKWIMTGFTMKTKSGRVLSGSYASPSTPSPSGSTNAGFTFTPDASIIDSTIIVTISLQDLGPWYCDSLLTRYIFVAPRPIADFKFIQPVCDGDNVIFANTSKVSSGNLLHKWNFGTGNPADTSINADVVFTFPTYGTYNVKLTTTTSPYGYTNSITIPVEVTEIPKIGFKVFNACLGDSVSFVNTTTISKGAIAYKWDFGNGKTSAKINVKQKYPNAGSYKVTLIATSNGCSQSLSKNAWEFARPVAKFTTPSVVCDKTDITFTNGSTISTGNMGYKWTFSDGGISTFTNPTHEFADPGGKTVKMKVISEFGCADSITKNINLAEAPSADFIYGAVCNLTNTNFTFTGSKPATPIATAFSWDFGGEGFSTAENPSKLLSIIGKKPITLTVTSNNGCTDMIVKEVNVKLQSKADFETADVCDGENAIFTNTSNVSSGNLNYFWKFGDGSNSTSQAPRHLYALGLSNTYNVTLVAIVQGGCSDSITKPVSVNSVPSSAFTYSTSGRAVSFKATLTGAAGYHWDFGDGGNAEVANTQYSYLNYPSGVYTVCLSVTNAADCFSQTCKDVAITGGIEKLNKLSGVKIYPNPNKGNFTVNIEEPKSDISIGIYSVLGDLIKTIETSPLKSVYSIDLNVANGVYMVKVTNGGLTSTQKITINK